MTWVRKYPVFAATMIGLGLLVLVEAGCLVERCTAARAARKHLERASRDLRSLTAIQPAPTAASAMRIEADLVRVTAVLVAMQAELIPRSAAAVPFNRAGAPLRRPEAFFEIAAFVEAMRARALEAGVGLKAGERFGFSGFANEAPESGQISVVLRERLVVQHVLDALMEARPHELLSVQRQWRQQKSGRMSGGGRGGVQAGRLAGTGALDYFDLDPRISVQVPGTVETDAFRFSFTGHTAALRTLLNKLAEFDWPVVVRSVEVAPMDRPAGSGAATRSEPVPLIAPPWSRFTVTVEFVAVAPLPTTAS